METAVTPRQLPGLALLGLLAALLAHAASYGGEHEAGGVYHTVLLLTAIAGAGGFGVATAILVAFGSRRHGDGSLLAAALRPALPSPVPLTVAASAWFAVMETMEPHHVVMSPLAIAMALILAALVVCAGARRFINALAKIVFCIIAAAHRRRAAFAPYIFAPRPSARAVAFAYRRFARPPPALVIALRPHH
jgi:hypothetical protein